LKPTLQKTPLKAVLTQFDVPLAMAILGDRKLSIKIASLSEITGPTSLAYFQSMLFHFPGLYNRKIPQENNHVPML
jgi:hypothetical protein